MVLKKIEGLQWLSEDYFVSSQGKQLIAESRFSAAGTQTTLHSP